MYQLTYQSTAILGTRQEHLEQIIGEARTVNLEKNVTGCLVYYRDKFVRILEGDRRSVLKLYAKIKLDNRHHSVKLLWEGNAPERYFQHWSMAYYHQSYSTEPDENEETFKRNLSLLSDLSSKPTSSILSFWATVREFLNGSPKFESF